MLNHARHIQQGLRQAFGIIYRAQSAVINIVTAISNKRVVAAAQIYRARISGRGQRIGNRRCRRAMREHIDLNRQIKRAQRRDLFAVIGNDNHSVRRRRDDFLAQQSPATAFNQAQRIVQFIGTINRQIEAFQII